MGMNILNCLNDTKTQQLICMSDLNPIVTCTCFEDEIENKISFDVNSTDVYTNISVFNEIDGDGKENGSFNHIKKMHDCFELNNTNWWECRTL